MNYYLKAFKLYATFNGRARRAEYWQFTLIDFIISVIISLPTMFNEKVNYFYIIYALIAFLPKWTVSVRRLHDVGKSGWFLLINLIPVVGAIWVLVLSCRDGEAGSNRFGFNPKEHDEIYGE